MQLFYIIRFLVGERNTGIRFREPIWPSLENLILVLM